MNQIVFTCPECLAAITLDDLIVGYAAVSSRFPTQGQVTCPKCETVWLFEARIVGKAASQ